MSACAIYAQIAREFEADTCYCLHLKNCRASERQRQKSGRTGARYQENKKNHSRSRNTPKGRRSRSVYREETYRTYHPSSSGVMYEDFGLRTSESAATLEGGGDP